MFSRLSGKSGDKAEVSSSRAQDDDMISVKSSRRKHKSDRSEKSTLDDSKKKASSSKTASRGDERDRGFDDVSEAYTTNGRSRADSTSHKSTKSRDKDRSNDDDDKRKKSARSDKMADSATEGKKTHRRRRSRSAERGVEDMDKTERSLVRRSTDPVNARSEASERTRAAFDAPSSAGQGFSQFPGQFSSQMPGMPGGFHRVDSDPTSQHSYDNSSHHMPGQFPTAGDSASRPTQAAHEGGIGLAADYYNDQGQSVHHQPGARPGTPVIAGTQPHLISASQSANPPPEPSSSGGVGAAASFYNTADSGLASAKPPKSGKTSKPSKPGKSSGSSSSTKPSKILASSGAALGASAGYFMSGAQPDEANLNTNQTHLSASQDVSPRMSPDRPSSYHTANGAAQSSYSQGTSSSHANAPIYAAAAAAGAAGYAAYSHHQHQQRPTSQYGISDEYSKPPPGFHYASDHNHAGYASGSGTHAHGQTAGYANGVAVGMSQQHKHRGPIARLVDFFRDPQAVSEFEEYTEYIGVCRDCFDPRSSARDAPRKHHYGRSRKSWERINRSGESLHQRRSFEKFNSSQTSLNRVDKGSRRYASGSKKSRRDSEYESDRKTSGFFKGAAAATAAGIVGERLTRRNEDFQDTYSVKSGRAHGESNERRRRDSSSDRERKGRSVSHGIISDSRRSDRRDSKADTEKVKRLSNLGHLGSTNESASERRRRSSKERNGDRKDKSLMNAAIGAAVGGTAISALAASRRRSSSPNQRNAKESKVKKRRDSSASNASSRSRRRKKTSNSRSGILSGLFGGGSSKKSKSSKNKKRDQDNTGFFGLSNASRSSTDSALIFDNDTRNQRSSNRTSKGKSKRRRSESPRIKSDSDARNAVLALGAGVAALSAVKSGSSSDRARKDGLKGKHRIYDHGATQASGLDEDVWEDASEDDSASVDSALAFGIGDGLRSKRSRESLSDASVSNKWSWRWGRKESRSHSRSSSPRLRDRNHVHTPTAAKFAAAGVTSVAGLAAIEHMKANDRNGSRQDSYFGSSSEIPLRQIEPRPVNESNSTPEAQHYSAAGPDIIPLQQPQPISPVKKDLYNMSQVPAEDHRQAVAQEEGWSGRRRRTTSSPPPLIGDMVSKNGKRSSRGPDDPRLLRFKFDAEQQERHNREEAEERRKSEISGVEYIPGDNARSRRDSQEKTRKQQEAANEPYDRREPSSKIVELEREIAEIDKRLAESQRGADDKPQQRRLTDTDHDTTVSSATPYVGAAAAALAGGILGKAITDKRKKSKVGEREEKRKKSDSVSSEKGKQRPGQDAEQLRRHSDDRDEGHSSKPSRSSKAAQEDIDLSKEQLASVGLERITRDVAQKVRSRPRSKSPSVQHTSYAEYFAPIDETAKQVEHKDKTSDPSKDNDIQVNRTEVPDIVTVEPHGPAGKRSISPFSFAPDAFFNPDTSQLDLPWRVPSLELIRPTPAASPRVGPVEDADTVKNPQTVNRVNSQPKQTSIAKKDSTAEDHGASFGKTSAKPAGATAAVGAAVGAAAYISSRKKHGGSRDSDPSADASSKRASKSKEPESPVDEELSRDDIEREEREWRRNHIPGGFDDDLDFTAHVAAGMKASGFDPEPLIQSETFRQRQSPPGSGDEFVSASTERGKNRARDASFERQRPTPPEQILNNQSESPKLRTVPPVQGFIEDGSVPNTPAEELKNVSRAVSEGAGLDSEPETQAGVEDGVQRLKNSGPAVDSQTREAATPGDISALNEWEDSKLSKKEKKKRDKEKRKSMEAGDAFPDTISATEAAATHPVSEPASSTPNEQVSSQPGLTQDDQDDQVEWASLSKKEKKKREKQKRQSIVEDVDPQTASEPAFTNDPVPDAEWEDTDFTKKGKKKRDKEKRQSLGMTSGSAEFDQTSLDSQSHSVPEPVADGWEDPMLSKKDKKKKRDKERVAEAAIAVSAAAVGAPTSFSESPTTYGPRPVPEQSLTEDDWSGLSKKERKKREKEVKRSSLSEKAVKPEETIRLVTDSRGLDSDRNDVDMRFDQNLGKADGAAVPMPGSRGAKKSLRALVDKAVSHNDDEMDFINDYADDNPAKPARGFSDIVDAARSGRAEDIRQGEVHDTPSPSRSRDEFFDAEAEAGEVTPVGSRSQSKVRDGASTPSAAGVPLPETFESDTPKYERMVASQELPARGTDNGSSTGDSAAETTIGIGEDKERRKKKKKRRSGISEDDDVKSAVSAPIGRSKGRDSPRDDKKKGGLFGLFRKATEDSADKRRKETEATTEMEERKERKKKHRRSREGASVYGSDDDTRSIVSRVRNESDDEKQTSRSHSKDEKHHKHRSSSRHSRAESEHRDRRDLPAKRSDGFDSQGTIRLVEDDSSISNEPKNPENSQSFLGERPEDTKPPDILGKNSISRDVDGTDIVAATVLARALSSDQDGSYTKDEVLPGRSINESERESEPPTIVPASPAKTPKHRSNLSIVSDGGKVGASSPTAVPLVFRRPPNSRTSSITSTPAAIVSAPTTPGKKDKDKRPGSTEFKGKADFRPLYLVERHTKSDISFNPDEELPALPSSKGTSRASSVNDDGSPRQGPIESPSKRFLGEPLDLGEARNFKPVDGRDIDQLTPTPATVRAERAKREQDLLDAAMQEHMAGELEWLQRQRKGSMLKDPSLAEEHRDLQDRAPFPGALKPTNPPDSPSSTIANYHNQKKSESSDSFAIPPFQSQTTSREIASEASQIGHKPLASNLSAEEMALGAGAVALVGVALASSRLSSDGQNETLSPVPQNGRDQDVEKSTEHTNDATQVKITELDGAPPTTSEPTSTPEPHKQDFLESTLSASETYDETLHKSTEDNPTRPSTIDRALVADDLADIEPSTVRLPAGNDDDLVDGPDAAVNSPEEDDLMKRPPNDSSHRLVEGHAAVQQALEGSSFVGSTENRVSQHWDPRIDNGLSQQVSPKELEKKDKKNKKKKKRESQSEFKEFEDVLTGDVTEASPSESPREMENTTQAQGNSGDSSAWPPPMSHEVYNENQAEGKGLAGAATDELVQAPEDEWATSSKKSTSKKKKRKSQNEATLALTTNPRQTFERSDATGQSIGDVGLPTIKGAAPRESSASITHDQDLERKNKTPESVAVVSEEPDAQDGQDAKNERTEWIDKPPKKGKKKDKRLSQSQIKGSITGLEPTKTDHVTGDDHTGKDTARPESVSDVEAPVKSQFAGVTTQAVRNVVPAEQETSWSGNVETDIKMNDRGSTSNKVSGHDIVGQPEAVGNSASASSSGQYADQAIPAGSMTEVPARADASGPGDYIHTQKPADLPYPEEGTADTGVNVDDNWTSNSSIKRSKESENTLTKAEEEPMSGVDPVEPQKSRFMDSTVSPISTEVQNEVEASHSLEHKQEATPSEMKDLVETEMSELSNKKLSKQEKKKKKRKSKISEELPPTSASDALESNVAVIDNPESFEGHIADAEAKTRRETLQSHGSQDFDLDQSAEPEIVASNAAADASQKNDWAKESKKSKKKKKRQSQVEQELSIPVTANAATENGTNQLGLKSASNEIVTGSESTTGAVNDSLAEEWSHEKLSQKEKNTRLSELGVDRLDMQEAEGQASQAQDSTFSGQSEEMFNVQTAGADTSTGNSESFPANEKQGVDEEILGNTAPEALGEEAPESTLLAVESIPQTSSMAIFSRIISTLGNDYEKHSKMNPKSQEVEREQLTSAPPSEEPVEAEDGSIANGSKRSKKKDKKKRKSLSVEPDFTEQESLVAATESQSGTEPVEKHSRETSVTDAALKLGTSSSNPELLPKVEQSYSFGNPSNSDSSREDSRLKDEQPAVVPKENEGREEDNKPLRSQQLDQVTNQDSSHQNAGDIPKEEFGGLLARSPELTVQESNSRGAPHTETLEALSQETLQDTQHGTMPTEVLPIVSEQTSLDEAANGNVEWTAVSFTEKPKGKKGKKSRKGSATMETTERDRVEANQNDHKEAGLSSADNSKETEEEEEFFDSPEDIQHGHSPDQQPQRAVELPTDKSLPASEQRDAVESTISDPETFEDGEEEWGRSFNSAKRKKDKKSKRASFRSDQPLSDEQQAMKPILGPETEEMTQILARNEAAVAPLPEDDLAPLTRKRSNKNKRVSWPAESDLVIEHEISAPPSGIATPAELNISIPSAAKDVPPGTTADQIPSPSWDTSPTETRDEEEAWGFKKKKGRHVSRPDQDADTPQSEDSAAPAVDSPKSIELEGEPTSDIEKSKGEKNLDTGTNGVESASRDAMATGVSVATPDAATEPEEEWAAIDTKKSKKEKKKKRATTKAIFDPPSSNPALPSSDDTTDPTSAAAADDEGFTDNQVTDFGAVVEQSDESGAWISGKSKVEKKKDKKQKRKKQLQAQDDPRALINDDTVALPSDKSLVSSAAKIESELPDQVRDSSFDTAHLSETGKEISNTGETNKKPSVSTKDFITDNNWDYPPAPLKELASESTVAATAALAAAIPYHERSQPLGDAEGSKGSITVQGSGKSKQQSDDSSPKKDVQDDALEGTPVAHSSAALQMDPPTPREAGFDLPQKELITATEHLPFGPDSTPGTSLPTTSGAMAEIIGSNEKLRPENSDVKVAHSRGDEAENVTLQEFSFHENHQPREEDLATTKISAVVGQSVEAGEDSIMDDAELDQPYVRGSKRKKRQSKNLPGSILENADAEEDATVFIRKPTTAQSPLTESSLSKSTPNRKQDSSAGDDNGEEIAGFGPELAEDEEWAFSKPKAKTKDKKKKRASKTDRDFPNAGSSSAEKHAVDAAIAEDLDDSFPDITMPDAGQSSEETPDNFDAGSREGISGIGQEYLRDNEEEAKSTEETWAAPPTKKSKRDKKKKRQSVAVEEFSHTPETIGLLESGTQSPLEKQPLVPDPVLAQGRPVGETGTFDGVQASSAELDLPDDAIGAKRTPTAAVETISSSSGKDSKKAKEGKRPNLVMTKVDGAEPTPSSGNELESLLKGLDTSAIELAPYAVTSGGKMETSNTEPDIDDGVVTWTASGKSKKAKKGKKAKKVFSLADDSFGTETSHSKTEEVREPQPVENEPALLRLNEKQTAGQKGGEVPSADSAHANSAHDLPTEDSGSFEKSKTRTDSTEREPGEGSTRVLMDDAAGDASRGDWLPDEPSDAIAEAEFPSTEDTVQESVRLRHNGSESSPSKGRDRRENKAETPGLVWDSPESTVKTKSTNGDDIIQSQMQPKGASTGWGSGQRDTTVGEDPQLSSPGRKDQETLSRSSESRAPDSAVKTALFETDAVTAKEGLHRSKTVRRQHGRHSDEVAARPSSPQLPSYSDYDYMTPKREAERDPSPIDSTSKERSSAALFSSSPSVRDTPTHSKHQRHRSIGETAKAEDHEATWSPPTTPGFGRAGTPLMTVTEQSPEESAVQRLKRVHRQSEQYESSLKPMKRRSAYGLAEHRAGTRSPLPELDKTRRLGHISGEDLHGVYKTEGSQERDSARKGSGRHERPHSMVATGDMDPTYRPFSTASVRSTESISAFLKEERPTSASPSLRHEKRSVSSDLRKVSRDSVPPAEKPRDQDNDINVKSESEFGADTLAGLGLAGTALAATAASLAGPSTYDPATDKGKAPITRMTDVYEAWGGQPGSPRSPSRPPSVRRRQSLQILDLEGRLDSLVSENRLLQDSRAKAERQLETISSDHSSTLQTHQESINTRDVYLQQKDQELEELRNVLNSLQGEVARLTEVNREMTETQAGDADVAERYRLLQAEHAQARQMHQESSRELTEMREKHSSVSRGMESMVAAEVAAAVASKNAELDELRSELGTAQEKIRALQEQILASRSNPGADDILNEHDEDYFDTKCQQLCHHVQQWVLRFSKFSDKKMCRSITEIRDEKIIDRFESAILDGTEVDDLLSDRVRRRDVFMSVVMTMIFEFVFTRYLFGMDREQRQKLKALEKTLSEVGTPAAVNKWRATTLTLLSQRNVFRAQREQDTEAVVQEIYDTLAAFLPPPTQLVDQIHGSLIKVLALAVDLSIEMRTQRVEYVMLPPQQPEYDTNGDLLHTVDFRDGLMNERSGEFSSNDDVPVGSVVRIVLFPLVVKRGDVNGEDDEDEVVCPAQVLIAKENERRGNRAISEMPGAMKSKISIAPSTYGPGSDMF